MSESEISFGVSRLARDLSDYVEWVKLVDTSGYDMIGYGDSQCRWTDPYAVLTLTATVTSHVRLGTFVTNPITRHPVVSANAIATVNMIAKGRAYFGVGTGETASRDSGEPRPTVAALEEYAVCVRELLTTRESTYRGKPFRIMFDIDRVPVWISALGPKTLRMAGRVGDGVIVGNGATTEIVKNTLAEIAAGAREAGRDPSDLEVWFMTRVYLASSREAAYDSIGFYLATYAFDRMCGKAVHCGVPIPAELQDRLSAFREEFHEHEALCPDSVHNAQLIDKYDLRDYVGRNFAVAGTPDECIKQLSALAGAGETRIVVPQMLTDVIGPTRQLAEQILPAFA